MKRRKNTVNENIWFRIFPPLGFLILFVLIWEGIVKITQIEDYLLPAPSQVWEELLLSYPLLWDHSLMTITETIIGFLIAALFGILTAMLIDQSQWIRRTIYPILVISQTIPYFTLAPFFILLLGVGMLPKIVIISLVCFFPIAVSLAEGFQSVHTEYVQLLKTMQASRLQIFWHVKWPAAMPSLFSGLRIASTYSIMSAVIAELFGSTKGLGILLTLSAQSYLADRVFATVAVIILLSLCMFLIVEGVARLTMRWYYHQSE